MKSSITNETVTYNTDSLSTVLTAPELAEYLNIGKNRAYELLRTGEIKGFRIGTTWRVSKAAVEQYILNQSGFNITLVHGK